MVPDHVTESIPSAVAGLPENSTNIAANPTGPACRVILDSNIWIDILVFNDPISRPIVAALKDGRLCALIDTRCLAELTCVLDYPQFARHAIDKSQALARVAQLSRLLDWVAPADQPALPKCKDRDDQKFLELTQAANADWLVSKDRALLKLSRHTTRGFGFRIAVPAALVAACGLDDQTGSV
jgi:putative PIN family toxin of toxin-antitoxin system